MDVNHFVTLYLTTATAAVVDAVQGDGVRVIAARLMEGAEPWPVPDGVSAGIGYELPDKTGGYYDRLADGTPACMIAGDLVTAAIDGSLTAIPGNVKLSIVLRDSDGGQVATFPVTMRVAKRPGRIGAEEMAPVSAFDGKLIMGGAGGETIPVSVGTGLHIQRLGNGAVLTAPGGSSEAPGGSCDCGDAYVASDEPPEDTDVLWVDTSEPDEAVALGAAVEETAEGVVICATDELGTTKALVRHGRDGEPGATGAKGDPGDPGAPGADGITPHIGENGNWWIGATDTGKPSRGADGKTPTKGVDYFTPEDVQEIAEQAAGMVEVPGAGGGAGKRVVLYDQTIEIPEDSPVRNISVDLPEGASEFDVMDIYIEHEPAPTFTANVIATDTELTGLSVCHYGLYNVKGKRMSTYAIMHIQQQYTLWGNCTVNSFQYNWTSPKIIKRDEWSGKTRTNKFSQSFDGDVAGTIKIVICGYA